MLYNYINFVKQKEENSSLVKILKMKRQIINDLQVREMFKALPRPLFLFSFFLFFVVCPDDLIADFLLRYETVLDQKLAVYFSSRNTGVLEENNVPKIYIFPSNL